MKVYIATIRVMVFADSERNAHNILEERMKNVDDWQYLDPYAGISPMVKDPKFNEYYTTPVLAEIPGEGYTEPIMCKFTETEKRSWVSWLENYGLLKFLDSFLYNVEGAESTCRYCGEKIYVDVMIGGGVPDWSTEDGDFGCYLSPDTDSEGTGGHLPVRRSIN